MASRFDEADIDDSETTANLLIDGLLTEYHWSLFARDDFQFTIPDSASDYEDTRDALIDDYPDDNYLAVFQMPAFMINGSFRAVDHYEDILNFDITQQADNDVDVQLRYAIGDLTNDGEQPPPPAYAHTPQDDGLGQDQANWM